MILKELILNNIGPYEGENHFTLEPDNEKNTILIGGKNGSGKTTFLTTLRLALYGPLAYGYKTESKEYLNKVKSFLNNKMLNNPNHKSFYIQINFSLVEEFKSVNVSLIRSWVVNDKSIKEKVEIIKENAHLDDILKDEFFERLRTNFPPSLLELCFFDGEDISKLSNQNKLSEYLKELSTKLFNLDLFQNLERDLSEYISQSSKSSKEEKLESEKEITENELTEKINKLKSITEKINYLKEELNTSREKYNQIKSDFYLHGGLAYKERDKVQSEISTIEAGRKITNDKIKEFIANELPFFIAYPKLNKLVEQLDNEESFYISNVFQEKIDKLPINKILKDLDIKDTEDKQQQFKESLIENMVDREEISIIHNASKSEANQVYNLSKKINQPNLTNISKLIIKNQTDLSAVQKLRKTLKDNDSTSEFNEMIVRMESYSKTITDNEKLLEPLVLEEKKLADEISVLNKKYEKQKNEIHNIYKTKASYHESVKVLNISKRFQEDQLRKKIKDVEYFSSKMIKELLRKDLFINQVKIDSKSFNISILDYDYKEINKDILSAGEQELLVLSIIWGTITSSKKQLPFVMDTLLGRLDVEHKRSVVSKLIPSFGKQIIILSTDSEINNSLYYDLSPYVSSEYTLNYKNEEQRTEIQQSFFNLNSGKVVY